MYEYGIQKIYGFSIYPDEFGYWASAAQWIGYDWSETVSQASYYSFGYSLILTPILLLCKSGVAAYRAAVLVNVLLQILSIGLLYGIYRRLFYTAKGDGVDADTAENGDAQGREIVFAVGAAVFYPVWTFYAQMTLTEALLAFLYALICWLLLCFLEKPTCIRAMLLSIALIYLHFVHMRTVGVVIAAGMTLFLYAWRVREARKAIVSATLILLAGIFIGMQIRNAVIGNLYAPVHEGAMAETGLAAGNAIAAANGYAAQIANVKAVLNPEGILLLLKSCVGKLYYLGMSSFGLIYPAIGGCVAETFKLLHRLFHKGVTDGAETKEKEYDPQGWMFLFLLLSFLGQFMISAIYMRSLGRLDGIVYGRYNDYLVPVFIGIGVLALWENRHLLRYTLAGIAVSAVLLVISWDTALHSGAVLMHGCHAAGLNYVSDDLHFYEITPEFVKAFGFGICLLLLVTGCIAFVRKIGAQNPGLSIVGIGAVLLMEGMLTFRLDQKYIYYFNDMNYYDLEVYEYIEDYEKKENKTVPVYYLHDGGQIYINLIQFAMQDETLHFIYEKKEDGDMLSWEELEATLPVDGFLVTDCDDDYLPGLDGKYRKCVESRSGGFTLFMLE